LVAWELIEEVTLQMEERRQFPRLPVTAPVICSRYGKRMTMRALDISQEGLKLEATFDLRVGESLDLAILLNGTEIRCRGKVVAVEELGRKVRARVRFTRTASSEQRKLSDHIHILSMSPLQRGLIGGLLLLAVVSLIGVIVYSQYFRSGPERGDVGENRQFESDVSGNQVPASKMEAGLRPPEEGASWGKERVLPVPPGRAVFSQGGDVREPSTEIAHSRPSAIISESRVESEIIQDASGDPELARLEGQESGEVLRTQTEVFLPSSGKRMKAAVVGKDTPPRVSRPAIRRSTIALGVEDREPVGMSKRVSVSQGRVYCWIHVINGKGGAIIVRWIGEKGKRIADVDLRVGSNSWRTWSYLSLRPSMIGPAQVEIRDENGEILETLPFEITE
jgi:hypothetical protein